MRFLFLFSVCVLFLLSCDPPKSKHNGPNALEHKIQNWYNKGISDTQKNQGDLRDCADSIEQNSANLPKDYQAMGKLLKALSYAKNSKDNEMYKSLVDAKGLLVDTKADSLKIRLYNGFGRFYQSNGEYSNAVMYFLKAMKLAEKTKNRNEIAISNSNLGELYLYQGDMKTGKSYLTKAMDLLKVNKNRSSYLINCHTMANYYGMTNDFESALKLDEECLKICDKNGFNRLKVMFLDNKANCFLYTNQLDSAERIFNECLLLDRINGSKQQESDSYLNLAHIAKMRNDKNLTLKYIDSSFVLIQKTNYKAGYLKAGEIKMQLYQSLNDYKGLSEAMKEYHQSYKSLMNEKKEKAFAQYQTIYETEKKEIKLLKSKVDLTKKEKEIQAKNNLLLLFVVITIAVLGLGYLIYRQMKMRNVQQEKEFALKSALKEIESQNQLQEQRLHISRDLHDNIGAQLTFIISSVENLNYAFDIKDQEINHQLVKINDFAKSTIIELRDTIWAMNSNQISNENLKERIYNFLEKAQGISEAIKFNFSIQEDLVHYSFSSLVGINVYRTLQEAVNNAIKYADATNIHVVIKKDGNQIVIKITDNGKGFEVNNIQRGNGLVNMRKRMEEIGGTFNIQSLPDIGTEITLKFN